MKGAIDGSLVDWTWQRKETLSLRICHRNFQNLKTKKKDFKKKRIHVNNRR